ncbi:hypothetical protein [Acinetobacter sp. Marseille-Q1618]|uniref:hypothetical protein n=1 Tax=Acinetobacter sp. Marseille-Q1618 TaxID=2697502 RepID=UPI00157019F7|nr:hypothetical protein [Acinetobacter sp. Marseille-Q1618]
MNYPEYQNDLNKLLESEILGEAVFLSAAKHAKSPQQKQKWLALAALEMQTLERFQIFLTQNNLKATSRLHMKTQGKITGFALAKMPWKMAMYLLKDGTQPFMQAFQRLCQHADRDSQMFFEYVLNHEKSLYEFADKELKKQKTTSLDKVKYLLD